MRVPVRCNATRDTKGQIQINIVVDNFVGLDAVMAEEGNKANTCWTDQTKLGRTVTYDTTDESALRELGPNEFLLSKNTPHFDALIDFDLIRLTVKTLDVQDIGYFPVYRLQIPVSNDPNRRPSAGTRTFGQRNSGTPPAGKTNISFISRSRSLGTSQHRTLSKASRHQRTPPNLSPSNNVSAGLKHGPSGRRILRRSKSDDAMNLFPQEAPGNGNDAVHTRMPRRGSLTRLASTVSSSKRELSQSVHSGMSFINVAEHALPKKECTKTTEMGTSNNSLHSALEPFSETARTSPEYTRTGKPWTFIKESKRRLFSTAATGHVAYKPHEDDSSSSSTTS